MKKRNGHFEIKKLISFFYELGTLRKTPRVHMQTLLTCDLSDNIAAHSFRVAMIGYFLAKRAKANPLKVMAMCLFHDTAESRSGDHNWVHKKYVKVFEDEIIRDQMSGIDDGEILNLMKEYGERKSSEAILAKDADRLEQILLEREYAHAGNKEAEKWYKGQSQFNRLKTPEAKKLAKEMYRQEAGEWWWNDWTSERR